MVQTKFVKYKTSKVLLILSIAKIRENYFFEIANGSKFVKYRALENNQLYGNQDTLLILCYLHTLALPSSVFDKDCGVVGILM